MCTACRILCIPGLHSAGTAQVQARLQGHISPSPLLVPPLPQGPFAFSEFEESYLAGKFTETSLVYHPDVAEAWTEVKSLPKLYNVIDPAARRRATVHMRNPARKEVTAPAPAPAPARGQGDLMAAIRARAEGAPVSSGVARKAPRGSSVPKFQESAPAAPARGGSAQAVSSGLARVSPPDAWEVKRTADGQNYYFNTVSKELSWDKPDALKSAAELSAAEGEWVWAPDDRRGFMPAKVLGRSGNNVRVQSADGVRREVPNVMPGTDKPLPKSNPNTVKHLADTEDLVQLPADEISEAAMLACLAARFQRDQIYTWVGASNTVLISLNPFKNLPLYTPQRIEEHANPPANRRLPPHVFDIANDCYRTLRLTGQSQSVLISGESGAGKTEAAKQCLSFLAEVVGSENNVEQRLLQSNPLLEAFGNAKTVRNNNSSRFGKWVEYYISRDNGSIAGAKIVSYLLEKSRVVGQAPGERAYHILYQLTASNYGGTRFDLPPADTFGYCTGGSITGGTNMDITIPGVSDAAEFDDVLAACDELGFAPDEEVDAMFAVLAGILYLGNLSFAPKTVKDAGGNSTDGSQLAPGCGDSVSAAADLLGVSQGQLGDFATSRAIDIRGQGRTLIPLKPADAKHAVDALAKTLYGRLFDWLVQRINGAVAVASYDTASLPFIGVLDIFGFEIFELNSFEQLAINYCNEKLQQHFTKHTFKEESDLYKAEGVPVPPIQFVDNQPVLDLIEQRGTRSQPGGILVLLDDEVRVPKGSDESFVGKVLRAHDRNKSLLVQSSGVNSGAARELYASGAGFGVRHYAGDVLYDVANFLAKNKDSLHSNAAEAMATSSNAFIAALFADAAPEESTGSAASAGSPRGKASGGVAARWLASQQTGGGARGARAGGASGGGGAARGRAKASGGSTTIGGQFRRQLDDLMTMLYKTAPHYIRCVKTTPNKRPNDLHPVMVMEQLKYSGVFEAVEIRKEGYPHRLHHRAFVHRYACVSERALNLLRDASSVGGGASADWSQIASAVCAATGQDLSGVMIGETMAMYRAEQHRLLELMRNLALEPLVIKCQSIMRGGLVRRYVTRMRKVIPDLQAALRSGNDLDMLEAAVERAFEVLRPGVILAVGFEPPELSRARNLKDKLRKWRELEAQFTDLLARRAEASTSKAYAQELAGAIQVAESITDVPPTRRVEQLLPEAKQVLKSCAGALVDPRAKAALFLLDEPELRAALDLAAEYEYTSPDIREIQRILTLPEPELLELQAKKAAELNDPVRRVNRELKMQELHIDAHMAELTLASFPNLRDAAEYARAKLSGKLLAGKRDTRERTFLTFTDEGLSTSLTRLETEPGVPDAKAAVKDAVRLFKGVRMWAGDRLSPDPVAAGLEVVREITAKPWLRVEVFGQILKQLTENPKSGSVEKLWQLLYLCIRCFPVPESIELQVRMYMRHYAGPYSTRLTTVTNLAKYEPKSTIPPPTPAEVPSLLDDLATSTARSRWSVMAEDPISAAARRMAKLASAEAASGPGGGRARGPSAYTRMSNKALAGAGMAGAGPKSPTRRMNFEASTAVPEPGASAAAMQRELGDAASLHRRRVSVSTSSTPAAKFAEQTPAAAPPPVPAARVSSPQAEAVYDFAKSATDAADTLSIRAGERMDILDKDASGWWRVRLKETGAEGFVPGNYLREL